MGRSRLMGCLLIFITRLASSMVMPVASATSSTEGSRPFCCTRCLVTLRNLLIVSIICTGIRIVRAWSAIERVMAWRIHQVA